MWNPFPGLHVCKRITVMLTLKWSHGPVSFGWPAVGGTLWLATISHSFLSLLCCIPLCFHFMLSLPLFLLISRCCNAFTCVTFWFFLLIFCPLSPPSFPCLFLFQRWCVLCDAAAMKTPILQHKNSGTAVRKSTINRLSLSHTHLY